MKNMSQHADRRPIYAPINSLAEVLDRIPDHKINCIDEFLAWNRSLSTDPEPIT